MRTAYPLTAYVSLLHRLWMRHVSARFKSTRGYPSHEFIVLNNPREATRWRRGVLRHLQRSIMLKALAHYHQRYLVEVKAFAQSERAVEVGLFLLSKDAILASSRGRPWLPGTMVAYYDLYRHQLTAIPIALGHEILTQWSMPFPDPVMHFTLPVEAPPSHSLYSL